MKRKRITIIVISIVLLFCIVDKPCCQENEPKAQLNWAKVPLERTLIDPAIWSSRNDIIRGIEDNITFLASAESEKAYANFQNTPFQREKVKRSLERFRDLLTASHSATDLWRVLNKEFLAFKSVSSDGQSSVKFTGYFQPVYRASRRRTHLYKYPIYKLPHDFNSWSLPHPSRNTLEGSDGTGGTLHGHEIAWLTSRWESFMIHVQGSAILNLLDGTQIAVGYAGGTDYKFVSLTKEFLVKNKVKWGELNKFFAKYPEKLNEYLTRNNRFIFFKENTETKPIGSLGVPVIPERSIATDKGKLPPAALGIVRAKLPKQVGDNKIALVESSRIVLDQDSGSAIRGVARADVFMGTGDEAQRKANWLSTSGELFYLLLK